MAVAVSLEDPLIARRTSWKERNRRANAWHARRAARHALRIFPGAEAPGAADSPAETSPANIEELIVELSRALDFKTDFSSDPTSETAQRSFLKKLIHDHPGLAHSLLKLKTRGTLTAVEHSTLREFVKNNITTLIGFAVAAIPTVYQYLYPNLATLGEGTLGSLCAATSILVNVAMNGVMVGKLVTDIPTAIFKVLDAAYAAPAGEKLAAIKKVASLWPYEWTEAARAHVAHQTKNLSPFTRAYEQCQRMGWPLLRAGLTTATLYLSWTLSGLFPLATKQAAAEVPGAMSGDTLEFMSAWIYGVNFFLYAIDTTRLMASYFRLEPPQVEMDADSAAASLDRVLSFEVPSELTRLDSQVDRWMQEFQAAYQRRCEIFSSKRFRNLREAESIKVFLQTALEDGTCRISAEDVIRILGLHLAEGLSPQITQAVTALEAEINHHNKLADADQIKALQEILATTPTFEHDKESSAKILDSLVNVAAYISSAAFAMGIVSSIEKSMETDELSASGAAALVGIFSVVSFQSSAKQIIDNFWAAWRLAREEAPEGGRAFVHALLQKKRLWFGTVQVGGGAFSGVTAAFEAGLTKGDSLASLFLERSGTAGKPLAILAGGNAMFVNGRCLIPIGEGVYATVEQLLHSLIHTANECGKRDDVRTWRDTFAGVFGCHRGGGSERMPLLQEGCEA